MRRSAASPTACPCRSLRSLKRSASAMSRAPRRPSRRRRSTCSGNISSNQRRLWRVVKPSTIDSRSKRRRSSLASASAVWSWRTRPASTRSRLRAKVALESMSDQTCTLSSSSRVVGPTATTFAETGCPSSSDSSPKHSPGPSRTCGASIPGSTTSTVPSQITNRELFTSPVTNARSPGARERMDDAVSSACLIRGVSLSNRGEDSSMASVRSIMLSPPRVSSGAGGRRKDSAPAGPVQRSTTSNR